MANEIAKTETGKPIEAVKLQLQSLNLEGSLPSYIEPSKFRNVALTAISQNPELLEADRQSLFLACMDAANDGIMPDGREGAFVVYNSQVKKGGTNAWIKKIQFMPMAYGLIQKMYLNSDIASVKAYPAFANDKFLYVRGDEERLEHEPTMGDPGELICAYAIVKFKDGREPIREVMPRRDIERARSMSKSKDGPAWTNWFDEMARKCVIHRVQKYVPLPVEASKVIERAVIDAEASEVLSLPPSAPAQLTQSPPASKLESFESQAQPTTPRRGRPPKAETVQQVVTDVEPESVDQSQPIPANEPHVDAAQVLTSTFAIAQSRVDLENYWRSSEAQELLSQLNGKPEMPQVHAAFTKRHKELAPAPQQQASLELPAQSDHEEDGSGNEPEEGTV